MIRLCAVAHQRLMQFGWIDRKILCGTFARKLDNGRGTSPRRNSQCIELLFLRVDHVCARRLNCAHSS